MFCWNTVGPPFCLCCLGMVKLRPEKVRLLLLVVAVPKTKLILPSVVIPQIFYWFWCWSRCWVLHCQRCMLFCTAYFRAMFLTSTRSWMRQSRTRGSWQPEVKHSSEKSFSWSVFFLCMEQKLCIWNKLCLYPGLSAKCKVILAVLKGQAR